MEKKELKKILLRKKETALKKKQELIEENKEYHEKLANDFEKLRIALFTDLSEKFFFENKKILKLCIIVIILTNINVIHILHLKFMT